MASIPIALPPALPSELLSYVLSHQAYPTTLIICQPRATFLSSLLECINNTPAPPPPHTTEADNTSASPSSPPHPANNPLKPPERHPLLIPTLHQVATSRYVNLVFIPTVTHLRAYLAVSPPQDTREPPEQRLDKPGKNMPLVVVYGLVGLHRDTSEWSAQGLGSSLAGLVEAGWRTGRRTVVIEERKVESSGYEEGEGDLGGGDETRKGASKVWEEKVPMLNGSVRRAGLESEDGGWSGRTVEVGRILGRWFRFGKGDWCDEKGSLA
jgi:hypothetical protein